LTERHGAVVLRLPALFGEALRKNFLFDLFNPLPSFLNRQAYEDATRGFSNEERAAAGRAYLSDDGMRMMRLDRDQLKHSGEQSLLTAAFIRARFTARNFTNSRSAFQFYNLRHLARDIERCLEASIGLLHICSAPVAAGELHRAILGEEFHSGGPPAVREDMRSDHAHLWGSETPYLYGREQVMAELMQFARGRLQ
jgi:hypothetical protein